MSQTPTDQLQLAYELIQSNALKEAHKLLSDYLDDSPRDIDGWWLLVHATEDSSEAERALRQILRLDPSHEGARQLLTELESLQADSNTGLRKAPSFLDRLDENDDVFEDEAPAAASASGIKRLGSAKASHAVDDLDDFDDDFDSSKPERPRVERSGRRLLTAILGLLALVLVVAALLILGTQRGSTPEVTSVSGEPTTSATAATEEVTGAATQITSISDEDLLALFAPAVIAITTPADQQFEIVDTPQGRAATMLVCSAPSNRAIRTATFDGMSAMANASAGAESGVQNIGVQIVNCDEDNARLRFITVDVMSAQRFASGELTESQFAALWETQ